MKRSTNRKRHRPEEVVAKLRQADEALAKGTSPSVNTIAIAPYKPDRYRALYPTHRSSLSPNANRTAETS